MFPLAFFNLKMRLLCVGLNFDEKANPILFLAFQFINSRIFVQKRQSRFRVGVLDC